MSQSQQTDIGSSQLTLFDSEPDDLLFVTPSICPATPSAFQQVFNSFGLSFVQPSVSSSIAPDSLERFERVGPGRRGQYFLYDTMNHSDWVDWWLETDYGSNNKIPWESQHGSASETWKQFEQVAHTGTGSPKVTCKRCDKILEHPYATKKDDSGRVGPSRHGTTTFTRHLQTSNYRKTVDIRQQRGGLKRFLQSVCSSLLFFKPPVSSHWAADLARLLGQWIHTFSWCPVLIPVGETKVNPP
ncbi:unnamed protein product, partial [Penicillium salamii]